MLCVRAVQGWQFADFLNPKPENPDFIDNEPAPAFMGGRRGRGRGRSAASPSSQQQQQQQMQGLPEFENDGRSQEVHANIGRMGEESDAETVASSRSSGSMPEIVASPGADEAVVQNQNWPTVNGDLLRGLDGLDHMSDYSPSPVAVEPVEPVAVSKADTTQVSGLCAVPPTAAELAAPAPATPLPMEGTFCIDANADADMEVAAGVRDGQADMESSPDSDEDGLPGRPGRPSSSSKPDPPPPPPPLAPALAETPPMPKSGAATATQAEAEMNDKPAPRRSSLYGSGAASLFSKTPFGLETDR